MITKKNLSSKLTIAVLVVLLVFLADLKYRQYQNEKQIRAQTQTLQQQADDLQKQNDELSQSLQYLNSEDFKEKVARQQLNYKKQGEVVYGFSDTQTVAQQQGQVPVAVSNTRKWWNYFFATD